MGNPEADAQSGQWASSPESIEAAIITLSEKGLADYLRDSELAKRLAQEVADELGVGRGWVTLAFELLAPLIEHQAKAGAGWIARTAGEALQNKLQKLPFYDRLAGAISARLARLDQDLRAKRELGQVLAGRLSPFEARYADALSLDLQAHLQQLKNDRTLSAQMAEALDGIRALLNPQPPLSLRLRAQTEDARFVFGARKVGFLGRSDERQALDRFLDDRRPFCWWLIAGPGGQGKSRLALEFCLARGVLWRAGFLADTLDPTFWHTWRPERPTLLVCDYAGSKAQALREIAVTLFERGPFLDFPVRLLLLERNADLETPWRRTFEAGGNDGAAIRESRHAEPLLLDGLDDDESWEVILHFCRATGRAPPDRAETLGSLAAIDPERRPLFAHFFADAVGAGRSPWGWDQAALLRDVLDREECQFWESAGATDQDKNLLALATMTGGLPVATALSLDAGDLLPDQSTFAAHRYAAMSGQPAEALREKNAVLAPLEPDILGEFFVLRHLAPRHARDLRLDRLNGLSWDLAPHDKSNFLVRAAFDFPRQAALMSLCAVADRNAQQRSSWSQAVFYLTTAFGFLGDREAAIYVWEKLAALSSDYPDEPILRNSDALVTGNLILFFKDSQDVAEAYRLYEHLVKISSDYPDHLGLLRDQARGAYNLISVCLSAGETELARTMFDELAALARRQPDEPMIRLLQAMGTVNLIHHLKHDLPAARALWDRLDDLARAHPGEAALREPQSRGAFALIDAYVNASQLAAAQSSYDLLDHLASRHPDDPALREHQAKSAFNLISGYLNVADLPNARSLWERLDCLARRHPGESVLQEQDAMGASKLIIAYLGASDLVGARSVGDSLQDLFRIHPHEPALRKWYAKGAANLIGAYADATDIPNARSLWNRLDDLARAHPNEPALRGSQAMGAYNLILLYAKASDTLYAKASDIDAASVLWNQLAALARDHPGEPALREAQAKGAVCLINAYCNVSAREAARGKWEELAILTETHPNEPALRGYQGMGAFNLIIAYLEVGDKAPARELWDDLAGVAHAHPDESALHEWTAQGAVKLMLFAVEAGDEEMLRAMKAAIGTDPLLRPGVQALLAEAGAAPGMLDQPAF